MDGHGEGRERMRQAGAKRDESGHGREAASAQESTAPSLELEPLGIGALLDRAIEFVRVRPLACLGPAILFWMPAQYVTTRYLTAPTTDSNVAAVQALAAMGLAYVVTVFTTSAVAIVGQQSLLGRPITWQAGAKLFLLRLPLVVISNLLALLLIVPGLFACVLPGIYLAWRFMFAQIIVVIEGPNPVQALGRSWQLTRHGMRRWLALTTLATLLTLPMSLGATAFDSYGGRAWLRELIPSMSAQAAEVVSWLASCVMLGVPGAFGAVVVTVLYVDQCVRLEGRDLHTRLRTLELEAGAMDHSTREQRSEGPSPIELESGPL
ncbi:MAG: hypothetical protein ACI835_001902 [Planctomycetota bacterium]|jgi:hypothetical protein